ncbi:hypothetical protein PCE1_004901 [Barthelona sp. PCE]
MRFENDSRRTIFQQAAKHTQHSAPQSQRVSPVEDEVIVQHMEPAPGPKSIVVNHSGSPPVSPIGIQKNSQSEQIMQQIPSIGQSSVQYITVPVFLPQKTLGDFFSADVEQIFFDSFSTYFRCFTTFSMFRKSAILDHLIGLIEGYIISLPSDIHTHVLKIYTIFANYLTFLNSIGDPVVIGEQYERFEIVFLETPKLVTFTQNILKRTCEVWVRADMLLAFMKITKILSSRGYFRVFLSFNSDLMTSFTSYLKFSDGNLFTFVDAIAFWTLFSDVCLDLFDLVLCLDNDDKKKMRLLADIAAIKPSIYKKLGLDNQENPSIALSSFFKKCYYGIVTKSGLLHLPTFTNALLLVFGRMKVGDVYTEGIQQMFKSNPGFQGQYTRNEEQEMPQQEALDHLVTKIIQLFVM